MVPLGAGTEGLKGVLRTVVADGPMYARPRYSKGTGNLDTATRTST
jgi:hypothetical protein